MTDYNELVKALRLIGKEQDCNECEAGRWHHDFKCCLFEDAAAAIEDLQAEVKDLKRVNMELFDDLPKYGDKILHWVSVEERMPDRNDVYAVGWRYPNGCFYWGKVIFYDGKWQVDEEIPTPDYWMPIEPPQEVQDGPIITPCRGCSDYDGYGGCKSKGGCARAKKEVQE